MPALPVTLIGPRLFTGEDFLPAGTGLTLAGGRILGLGPPPAGAVPVRLEGGLIAPGFIDLQVNGGGGVLLNDDPSPATMARIARAHRRFGTTGLLATLISDRPATVTAALEAGAQAVVAGVPGLLGVHVEGPFLDAERRGVHPAAHLADPDEALLARLAAAASGPGRVLVTVSPNRVPPSAIRRLARAGVIVALGHAEASFETAMAAFDAGARGVTHLFNAMSPLGSRAPGLVGAALDRADAWCGLIADGHHVHPASLRIAIAAKPSGGALLVTDAMPPVGGPAGGFTLFGEPVTVADGACRTADGRLAGSALDMAAGVRVLCGPIGLPLAEALRMASRYPARALGMEGTRGRLAPGLAADLVWLDDALRVRATWIAGERADGEADRGGDGNGGQGGNGGNGGNAGDSGEDEAVPGAQPPPAAPSGGRS